MSGARIGSHGVAGRGVIRPRSGGAVEAGSVADSSVREWTGMVRPVKKVRLRRAWNLRTF
jgi:hypothetical protein